MANINKIRLSGQTYNIEDVNATKTVELTQAQYDALTVKDPNTFYIITDSQGVDLSNYYTRLETDDLLDTKLDVSAYTPTDLSNYYKKSETSGATQISTALASKANKSEIPSLDGYATETWVEDKGYLTEHQDISGKLDVSAFNTYSGSVNTQLNSKASESDLDALNDTVTAHTANTSIHVTAADKTAWNAKSDFSGDYNDLANKPTIPTVPTSNTAFTNDAGYITSSALDGYATTGDVQTATADMATKTWVGNQGYLTEHQSLSNYYKKSETSGATQISTALASKQDTLVSGTNIKTINGETLLGEGNITIEGGSDINVVQTTGTSTADVMSQDAVTTALNNKANKTAAVGGYKFGSSGGNVYLQYTNVNNSNIGSSLYYPKINGKEILTTNSIYATNNYNFQLVETSAITTSISSSSTDAQVPSAKAVNDQLGGLKLVKLTQSEYDALATKDSNTLYIING